MTKQTSLTRAEEIERRRERLRSPRAAAVAGILFAVSFTVSLVLLWLSVPEELSNSVSVERLQGDPLTLELAFSLLPLSGIAFLWFIGVIRDLIGELEDKLFSTVFLGSGLIFLAMIFAAAGVAGGVIATADAVTNEMVDDGVFFFGGSIVYTIMRVYAVRMAGVFMISLGTISMRAGIMPRPLIILTYILALVFLVAVSAARWLMLIFPAWVAVISVYVLLVNYRRIGEGKAKEVDQAANAAASSES